MTTGSNSNVSATGATLSASFEGATGTIYETGFYYGTSSGNLSSKVTTDGTNDSEGNFSISLVSLQPETKYYYKAYVLEYDANSSNYVERTATNVLSFTTLKQTLMAYKNGWLELPALRGDEDYFGYFFGSGGNTNTNRNYSYNYSYSHFGCHWVAYPLAPGHLSGSASSNWTTNPNIDEQYQIKSVVGSTSYPSKYGADGYSKGHQIPNADRKSNDTMNQQTYYVTNQTPQIGNKFNGSIWGSLENAIRSEVTDYQDTIYVVTGACYQTVTGNETVNQLTGSTTSVTPYKVDVPNYYWKVLLKVKWSGTGSNKTVQSACSIGFWYHHEEYESGTSFYASSYIKSVNEIEALTGFDFFTNLPGTETSGIEQSTETNKNWSTFLDF